MQRFRSTRIVFSAAAAAFCCLAVTFAQEQAGRQPPGNAGDRYLAYVSTDKPIYRGGETVYVRAVLLNAVTRTPLPVGQPSGPATMEIVGPKGELISAASANVQDSAAGFAWAVPADQPGGEYKVRIRQNATGDPPAERKFDVRAYRPPRLKSQIVFVRDGYGPGDTVGATMHVDRAEGGVPVDAKVTAVARVDGSEVWRGETKINSMGDCRIEFPLPTVIARGEGSLALVIEDGGVSETASKTIPILLQTVDLDLFPESGDLVADVSTRIYFEARTPAKKPADIAGVIVDEGGTPVGQFRSEHEGRGRFDLTPRKGGRYTLKINEPAGITTTFALPAVKERGAVVRSETDKVSPGGPVWLRVGSNVNGKLSVSLTQRGKELGNQWITPSASAMTRVEFQLPDAVAGVLTATVRDEKGVPLAERLVFREPRDELRVTLRADRETYAPGERVNLRIVTTNASNDPVSAVVGLTVTDDRTLEMIEKREQAPCLPVMVLLEADVRELADAHIYLDNTNPKAAAALDLLLGTQGWRRFAFVTPEQFLTAHGDAARRVLGLRTPALMAMDGWHAGGAGAPALLDFARGAPAASAAPVPEPAMRRLAELGYVARAEDEAADGDMLLMALEAKDVNGPAADDKKKEAAIAQEPVAGGRFVGLIRADDRRERLQAGAFAEGFGGGGFSGPLMIIREYAHDVRPNRKPDDRIDFAETLFWNTGVRTDEQTGEASVQFALSDSVTSFRAFADAFGASGALCAASTAIESVEPFYIEPKLPLEVTAGDVVRMPISLVNNLSGALGDVQLQLTAADAIRPGKLADLKLDARSRIRQLVDLTIGHTQGESDLVIAATGRELTDKVTHKLRVAPAGFPIETAFGGVVERDSTTAHTIVIPKDVVAASIQSKCELYPTPLANLTQALERLLQEPHGCFEQTSCTTYPLVMAQQYFLTHQGVDPRLIERSRELLERGYQKLIGFECKQQGYEWFGADPGHEALTAFGLLQFTDMSKVRAVDDAMLKRTGEWLMARRDGKGSFTQGQRTLHTWLPDPVLQTGYILWAALESGQSGFDRELAWFKSSVGASDNSYVWALGANVFALAGDSDAARKLMERISDAQIKGGPQGGSVGGAKTSVVGSGGEALAIETTALATLAWLREPKYAGQVEAAIRYLAECCKAGRFGSTQSTVLALRAIVEYDKQRARPKAAGAVSIYVDGQSIGGPVRFDESTQGAIALPSVAELLTPGTHKIELRMEGGAALPYSLAVKHHSLTPPSSPDCKLALSVRLSGTEAQAKVNEGELTEARVTITNRTADTLPTPVAIIGLPGGLEPRHDQLKELVKSGKIDAYEVRGREVILYWRAMQPKQSIELSLSLLAAIPGTYTGPASRAYLYYTDEHKSWCEGLKAEVTAR